MALKETAHSVHKDLLIRLSELLSVEFVIHSVEIRYGDCSASLSAL
jgi:hypothetical protein